MPASQDRRSAFRASLNDLASIAVIVLCAVLVWRLVTDRKDGATVLTPTVRAVPFGPKVPTEPLAIEDSVRLGSAEAKAALVVFSDFECVYCGAFAQDTMPVLKKEFVDKNHLVVAFRHLPLDRIHRNARLAAEGAECAGGQGKFWEMHDWLFANARSINKQAVTEQARRLGLNSTVFQECLAGKMQKKITRDVADAQALGISGTPTLLFGVMEEQGRIVRVTEVIAGASSTERIVAAVNRAMVRRQR